VFFDKNPAGLVLEWWCHRPTSYWFIAERNTITDEVLRTLPSSEIFSDRVEFSARIDGGAGV
jgi:sarcosine oxidase subunit delta